MSNRRRQNFRANDTEYGIEAHSGPFDDTLAEEYQHVNPAGPDDVPVRRRGRGGRRSGPVHHQMVQGQHQESHVGNVMSGQGKELQL